MQNNPLLKGEFERIAAQQPMAQMDMRRFELPEPRLQQREDVDAWRSAADNAAAQLEHQLDRCVVPDPASCWDIWELLGPMGPT